MITTHRIKPEELRNRIIDDWKKGYFIVVKDEVYGDFNADSLHHLFPQTKDNKRLYPDFIHDNRNLLLVYSGNHLNRPMPHINEAEFCAIMDIEKRSKVRGGGL